MPSAHGSVYENTTETYPLWKLFLFSLLQSYWLGMAQPVATKMACSSQEVQNCFFVSLLHHVSGSGLVQELLGNPNPLMWEPGAGSAHQPTRGHWGGFAISNLWVIAGVPPLPSAFQAAWGMSCGSYLLESMSTELIRSGILDLFLSYKRINTYLGISFICTVN